LALQDYLIKWYKAENFIAENGSNAVEVGSVNLNPAKFNNGWYSNNNSNYTTSPEDGWTPDEWIIEFWLKPDGNCSNAIIDNAGISGNFFWTWYLDNNNRIHVGQEPGGFVGHSIIIKTAGSDVFFYYKPPTLDYSSGDLVHYCFVYKRGTIGATSNTIRIYFQGALVSSSNGVPGAMGAGAGAFTFLNHSDHNRTIKSIEDNIKIYAGAGAVTEANITELLDNRNNEGFGVTGFPYASKFNNFNMAGISL